MNALPAAVELRNVELHERAGIMLLLPRRGLLARAQTHHDVADPRRLAGLERYVARLAVPLVQQAEHSDSILHRRGAGLGIGRVAGHIDRLYTTGDLGFVERRRGRGRRGDRRLHLLPMIPIIAGPARRSDSRQRRGDADDAAPVHASGVQAS